VRATLYAAANAVMMRTVASSEIKSWGLRPMRRKGRRRAVVAVARKLAASMHRMWADNTQLCHRPWGGRAMRQHRPWINNRSLNVVLMQTSNRCHSNPECPLAEYVLVMLPGAFYGLG